MHRRTPHPTFPGNLARIREAAGMSKPNLDRAAGLARMSTYQYEAGLREPSLAQVACIAKALGVTPGELLGGYPPGALEAKDSKPRKRRG